MDFLGRNANNQPQTVRGNSGGQTAAATSTAEKVSKVDNRRMWQPRWFKIAFIVLIFSVAILAIGIAILFYSGRAKEANFVDKNKEQAVFLTNGQVYFGKINDISSKYIDLRSIYYLNSSNGSSSTQTQQNAQTSFSLVKLGCELHGPADQMIINRDQVSFWENLTTDGKVTKAIQQWQSQNPNGQTCSTSNSNNSTQQSTGTTPNTKQ